MRLIFTFFIFISLTLPGLNLNSVPALSLNQQWFKDNRRTIAIIRCTWSDQTTSEHVVWGDLMEDHFIGSGGYFPSDYKRRRVGAAIEALYSDELNKHKLLLSLTVKYY